MNPFSFLDSKFTRPSEQDYCDWAHAQPRRNSYCSGCKSKSAPSPLDDIDALEVPPDSIDTWLLAIAHTHASAAARELGVKCPQVKWFALRENPRNPRARGWFLENDPSSIYLKAGISEDEIKFVTRHEVMHYADFHAGRPISEAKAEAFEKRPRPFEQPVIILKRPLGVHIGGNCT